jgi:hypothetical protein
MPGADGASHFAETRAGNGPDPGHVAATSEGPSLGRTAPSPTRRASIGSGARLAGPWQGRGRDYDAAASAASR